MMKKIIGIIGGGPAGMSCALWLQQLNFHPVIIEKDKQLGGLQTINPFHNTWYLGIHGQTGPELAQKFRRHIEVELLSTISDAKIKDIIREDDFKILTEEHEITIQGIVIATGQRFKEHESIESIEGSHQLLSSPRVCFSPGVVPLTYGQIVAVVGGGDNGLGIAIKLADRAKHIHLFVRSELRGFKMNYKTVLEYVEAGKITLHQPSMIHRFDMRGEKIDITFQDKNNSKSKLSFDHLCFRLGFAPNAEEIVRLFDKSGIGALELNPEGYIVTDPFLRTSIAKVYAAGDVANPRDPCVATAVAHGAIAARSVEEDFY